jgi:8-amino-7-oxononanoate synthase
VGTVRGQEVVSFASNDYLGLAAHPQVRRAAIAAVEKFGTGALAARLVVGTRSLHENLESALARWKAVERALVFPSGYAANIGVLTALGGAEATIFSDALNHASIIDGCRLARACVQVFRHGDLEHLAGLLAATAGPKIVVTETVFSMDGDRIDVAALTTLCARHEALLVLDEAHDVFEARRGFGDAEVLRVGTLSKTLGALGGFVAGPRSLIDLIENRARTFIFTTGLSPADAAAALAALEIVTSEEGDALRGRLRRHIDSVQPQHPSPILPIILGSESRALAASAALFAKALYVPAIRPPTVPPGTARLRVTLSATHTEPMVERLREALSEINR